MLDTLIAGRYRLEEELGRGRFGAVYAARTPEGQLVAVKLLASSDGAKRFRSEVEILRRVPPHPNVASFIDAGVHGSGLPFLVVELVAGEPLSLLLARDWPDLERAVAIGRGVLRGLGHLHASGVVHRDLNAGNIIIQASGEPKLVDFGLALDLGRTTRLTETGEVVGAAALLAPELLEGGGELEPAVDLYAASALLYYLLTRKPPFADSSSPVELARRIREEDPRLASDVAPGVPVELARAIARGLAKRPGDRPRSAEELAAFLRAPEAVELVLVQGKTFGPYALEEPLGRGGAGLVFRARDGRSGREVALKVLVDARDARSRERFGREAAILEALRDPGVPAVLEKGEALGAPYLALELVRGETLADVLARGIHFGSLAHVVSALAKVVARVHETGFVHADLKPRNVVLDAAGAPHLVDFGVAARTGEDNGAAGTHAYVSPEQARGERLRPSFDIYGLGAILYEGLTGKAPHAAPTPIGALAKAQEGLVRPPRELVPSVPAELERICLAALERNPKKRTATARDLALQLDTFVSSETLLRRGARASAARVVRARSFGRRSPGLALVIVAAFAALGVAFELVREKVDRGRAVDAYVDRAMRLELQGFPELALEDFATAIALAPGDERPWIHRGELRLRQRDAVRAVADFERAAELVPGRSDVLHLLARALLLSGDGERALATVDRALALYPDNPGIRATRAEVLLARGDAEGALRESERALGIDGKHGRALAVRGRAHARAGEIGEARTDLTRALELLRDPEQIAAVRSELGMLGAR